MDPGLRSPLIDLFRRGEVARDIRQLAAEGALAPRALEQLALLVILSDDSDAEIAASAVRTIDSLPAAPLRAFLLRADVPEPIRAFFAARGIEPERQATPAGDTAGSGDSDEPLTREDPGDVPAPDGEAPAPPEGVRLLSSLPIVERVKLAMSGTRSQRAQLIRDPNKLVAAAVLSSPKLSEPEIEAFARIATLPEEILRAIAANKAWMKNYGVVAGLARNPKTPIAIALQLLQRLNDRDMRALSMDRNIPEPVRVAARRYVVKSSR